MNKYPHYRIVVDGSEVARVSTPMEAIVYARSASCERAVIVSMIFTNRILGLTLLSCRNPDSIHWQQYKEKYDKTAPDDKFYFPLELWDSLTYN